VQVLLPRPRTTGILVHPFRRLPFAVPGALLLTLALGCGGTEAEGASSPGPPSDQASPGSVSVSFKLDPRLTDGLYMGELWVSPPVFSIALDGEGFIEARARCFDAAGAETDAIPAWTPVHADMVVVTPPQGTQVRIAIHRPGESSLRIACGALTRDLAVRAFTQQNGVLRAEITQ
jgi:hypothetical protein